MNQGYTKLFFAVLLTCILFSNANSEDAILSFRLVHSEHNKIAFLPQSEVKINEEEYECFTKENENYWVNKKIELDIQDVKDAKIKVGIKYANSPSWEEVEVTPEIYKSFDHESSSKGYLIDIYLNQKGKEKLAILTAKNIGIRLAIIFKGRLLMAPVIMDKITGGYIRVVGTSYEEAQLLKFAISKTYKK